MKNKQIKPLVPTKVPLNGKRCKGTDCNILLTSKNSLWRPATDKNIIYPRSLCKTCTNAQRRERYANKDTVLIASIKAKPGFRTCKKCRIPKCQKSDFQFSSSQVCLSCKRETIHTSPKKTEKRRHKQNAKHQEFISSDTPVHRKDELSKNHTNRVDDVPNQKSQGLEDFCIKKEYDFNKNNDDFTKLWLLKNDVKVEPVKKTIYEKHDGIEISTGSKKYHYCPILEKETRVYINLGKRIYSGSDDHAVRDY